MVSLSQLLSDGIVEGTERLTVSLEAGGTSGGLGFSNAVTILIGNTGSPPQITLGTEGGGAKLDHGSGGIVLVRAA